MHFGFSYVGLIFLMLLLTPNLMWTQNKPKDYEKFVVKENKVLLTMERVGEVMVSALCLIFSDLNSLLGIPVAGATLPVLAFGLLGVYGRNPILLVAVMILGIGHIGIHWNHRREIAHQ
jgi:hypothetical protein